MKLYQHLAKTEQFELLHFLADNPALGFDIVDEPIRKDAKVLQQVVSIDRRFPEARKQILNAIATEFSNAANKALREYDYIIPKGHKPSIDTIEAKEGEVLTIIRIKLTIQLDLRGNYIHMGYSSPRSG